MFMHNNMPASVAMFESLGYDVYYVEDSNDIIYEKPLANGGNRIVYFNFDKRAIKVYEDNGYYDGEKCIYLNAKETKALGQFIQELKQRNLLN